MELIALSRGNIKDINDYITQLQGVYLVSTVRDGKGNEQGKQTIQFGVYPLQLWGFVFPKESLAPVLTSLFAGGDGSYKNKKVNFMANSLRKIMKLKPIPKEYDSSLKLPPTKQNIEFIGIGIKEDEDLVLKQEGL